MNYIGYIKLIFLTTCLITGCTETFEPLPKVSFYIKVSDFLPGPSLPHKLDYVEELPFDSVIHKYGPGQLTFDINDKTIHTVDTYNKGLEEYELNLPTGQYIVSGNGGIDYQFARGEIPYKIPKQDVEISDSTSQINLTLESGSGMMQIIDDNNEVAECMINGPKHTYPFIKVDNMYYMYFHRHDGDTAIIRYKDGITKGVYLWSLKIGYISRIKSSEIKLIEYL